MKKNIKKYIPWIILLLIIISLSSVYLLSRRVTQEQISAYESKIQEAEQYLEAKQYSMSVTKYQEAVDIIPKKLDAYEGIISILLLKNRTEDAKEVVEKSATALGYYDRSVLYQMVGDRYYSSGEYGKASEMYDSGLTLGIRNTSLELMYGKVMLKTGEISDAKKYIQRSGFTKEEQAEASLILSYISSTEDVSRAEKFLNTTEPTSGYKIYYEEFSKILSDLDDDEKFNATKLSRVYINEGYPYLAIIVLEPLKDEIAEYLEGMYFLGRAYSELGNYSEAIQVLNTASTLGGMETEIFWLRARSHYMERDLENTVRDYDNAIGYMEENIQEDLIEEYLDILLEINQRLKAEEVVRNLAFNNPESVFANLLAVNVNNRLEEFAKVDYYLRQLEGLELEENQKKEYLQYKLLYLLVQDEYDEVQVEQYMEELFEIDRFNPHYYYFLAKVQEKEGDDEMAIQSLEKSIEYDVDFVITQKAKDMLSSLR